MLQELTQSQCVEYVRNIKNLEVSCYEQNLLHQNLNEQLGRAIKHYSDTKNTPIESPGEEPELITFGDVIKYSLLLGIPAALIGGIVGFVVRAIRIIFTDLTVEAPGMPYIYWGAGIAFVLVVVFLGLCAVGEVSPEAIEEYKSKVDNQRQAIAKRDSDLETQKKYISYLEKLIQQCERERQETLDILEKYYNLNYIYPKYRGIVPMCAIYEYLESGRCYSLTGPSGAYNLYENELLMNKIIGKLDDVIARLDDISYNQHIIAQEINKSHSQVISILASLDNSSKNIEQYTAAAEYYGRVAAANTSYLAWVDFLRH